MLEQRFVASLSRWSLIVIALSVAPELLGQNAEVSDWTHTPGGSTNSSWTRAARSLCVRRARGVDEVGNQNRVAFGQGREVRSEEPFAQDDYGQGQCHGRNQKRFVFVFSHWSLDETT